MPKFYIDLDGAEADSTGGEFATVDDARNAAIARLGRYLQDHPEYAYARHWRVDLRDAAHRLILHVIVGTVEAPPPINKASFDS